MRRFLKRHLLKLVTSFHLIKWIVFLRTEVTPVSALPLTYLLMLGRLLLLFDLRLLDDRGSGLDFLRGGCRQLGLRLLPLVLLVLALVVHCCAQGSTELI